MNLTDLIKNPIVHGAISGFVAAALIDIHAWSASADNTPFNWQLALKRWIGGAFAGATAGYVTPS